MISVSATGSPSKRSTASRLTPAPADVGDERGERLAQPGLLGLAERDERAAAALDEERRLAAEQDDVARRRPARRARRPASARQRGAVRLGRVGRREHERLGLLPVLRPQLAQPLDGAAERELRAAEPLDEVAAAAEAERLQRPQLAVDRAVAAGNPFGADAVAGDDPLPLEQQLGERRRSGPAGPEEAGRSSDQRPCVAVISPARRREKRRGRARSGAPAAW